MSMSRVTRTVALSASLVLWGMEVAATQEAFRVYCVAGGGGGLMMVGAVDSADDLREALRERRSLILVDSEDEADVVVRVMWRDDMVHPSLGGTRRPYKTVFATLEAMNERIELWGIGSGSWKSAAASLATQIEEVIEGNGQRWIALRDGSGGTGPPDAAGSEDATRKPPVVEIFRGMKTDDVERLLGVANKTVKFDTRLLWEYAGFRVIFEGGTVVDVAF